MEAIIKVSIKEFNQEFFSQLQEMFKKFSDGQVTIAMRSGKELNTVNESPAEYEKRLVNSLAELEGGKGITFTMESLEEYIKSVE
jgi:dissimilatory sulfite reductase (desulfoviridin) alpha/beta subunit